MTPDEWASMDRLLCRAMIGAILAAAILAAGGLAAAMLLIKALAQ